MLPATLPSVTLCVANPSSRLLHPPTCVYLASDDGFAPQPLDFRPLGLRLRASTGHDREFQCWTCNGESQRWVLPATGTSQLIVELNTSDGRESSRAAPVIMAYSGGSVSAGWSPRAADWTKVYDGERIEHRLEGRKRRLLSGRRCAFPRRGIATARLHARTEAFKKASVNSFPGRKGHTLALVLDF